jgi:hypothetical protein
MAKKSPQQFAKRQKEMERARKAQEKMAKRQGKKDNGSSETTEDSGTADEPITQES